MNETINLLRQMNNENLARFRRIYNLKSECYSHLSRLMIDPTPAVADNGVVYSNCFRRRTNHKSIKNIINATNLMLAHSPTYLFDRIELIKCCSFRINKSFFLQTHAHLYLKVSMS